MINIGVIGCGKVAQVRHLPEYAENSECRIAAVYDINTDRAKQIGRIYGAEACSSVEELLRIKKIDAVSVCTTNTTHAEISIAALNAGKHVLCEKPMAMTQDDCEKMVEAAARNNRLLMIDHNQRLAAAHIRARSMIADGEIGRVIRFKTEFSHCGPETWSVDPGKNVWFFDREQAVMGAMGDLGIHKTDLMQYLLDSHVKAVMGCVRTLDKCNDRDEPISVDDNAVCIYEMENGCIGTMTASWSNYGPECNSTVLYGTKGVMHIYDDPDHAITIEYMDGTRNCLDVESIQTNDKQTKSGVIDLWIESIKLGKELEMSGREALFAMRTVFAALKSSNSGLRVEV